MHSTTPGSPLDPSQMLVCFTRKGLNDFECCSIHPWIVADAQSDTAEGVSVEDCCDCSSGAVCRDEVSSVT